MLNLVLWLVLRISPKIKNNAKVIGKVTDKVVVPKEVRMIQVTVLDFSPESSLKFFSYQNENDNVRGFPVATVGNIYWMDAKSEGKIFGPFNNLYDALSHFKQVRHERKVFQELAAHHDNVLYVDFNTKKRLN